MGFRPRKKIDRVIVWAKPKHAPAWWPRNAAGKPEWVVVTDDGHGFSTLAGKFDSVPKKDARRIMDAFATAQTLKFNFRVVTA